jgi:hypothetical protein
LRHRTTEIKLEDRLFGHIDGYPEGTIFDSREALSMAGVHWPMMAGISGTAEEGADSIVLSGGYEDDAVEDEETRSLTTWEWAAWLT